MWTVLVIFLSPVFSLFLSIFQWHESVQVQTFIPQVPVK
ncbi:hypothetical protein NAL19_3758 [Pectobacterium sp. F1-1]|nr:hypothetical protein NAL19_3758 [Pectobacterium sp. F1-1]